MDIKGSRIIPRQSPETAPGGGDKKIEPKQLKAKQLKPAEEERLKEAINQFTALLFQQMFKAMRGTVPDDGLFKKDFAGQVYQDMFDTEISKAGADQNYFKGLNEQLYRQLLNKTE